MTGGAEGESGSVTYTRHTPPALLTHWPKPLQTWIQCCYLLLRLNHLVTGFDDEKQIFGKFSNP